ncbi:MAG: class I SAM-dependent methyltransferase [Dehalococcoidales bacterium]|nr:class I SAM-dependent methyltransferase [Dehalococcoidales bacterium]
MAHWTEELFKENPELFVGHFEERLAQAPREINALLRYLKDQGFRPERVLDLNCGIGRHAIALAHHGIQVLGTDISSHYIQIAASKAREEKVADRVKFRVVDMRRVTSSLRSEPPFDGIVCLWTSFGFYDNKTNENILRDCLTLVKPGGFFALDIVNKDWLLRNYSEKGFSRYKDWIVLEERKLDLKKSRNYNTWFFLKQTEELVFKVENIIELDHHIWSLPELITLFNRTGWQFKASYPGFATGFTQRKVTSASAEDDVSRWPMLLAISRRPD